MPLPHICVHFQVWVKNKKGVSQACHWCFFQPCKYIIYSEIGDFHVKDKKKMYIALHILPPFCLFWVSKQFSSLIMAISIGHYAFTIITNTYFHILYTKTCDKSWFSCVWRPQIHSSYKLRPQDIRRNFNLNTIRNCWGHPSLHISIIFLTIDPQSVMIEGFHYSVFWSLVPAM